MPSTTPTVLLTGFEPFGGEAINPSWLAVQALHGQRLADHDLVGLQLPTAFGHALEALQAGIRQHRPALVLCCGQAGGRGALSLERVAINVNDARIPDNTGAQPVDTAVVPGGPAAYFTNLPIKAMLDALQSAGLQAEVSQTAGTFVCNHVFYGLMHLLAQPGHEGRRGGFLHVPWLPAQGAPSMALERIVLGLRVAITCALATPQDIRRAAGTLS